MIYLVKQGWVCLDKNNAPQGMVGLSNGYPYKALCPAEVKFWDTKQKAEAYAKSFNFTVKNFELVLSSLQNED